MDLTARQENIDQLIHAAAQKETIVDYLEEAALIREDKDDEEESRGREPSPRCMPPRDLNFTRCSWWAARKQLFPHWRSMERAQDLEEERRLMYVAVTRAEKCLFITTASFRKGQFNPRSRFLDEIETVLMDRER